MAWKHVCGIFFWLKVLLSVILVLSILTVEVYMVYIGHQKSYSMKQFVNSADEIAISGSDLKCHFKGTTARLEPANDQFLWGMSIQWDVDDAIRLTNRLGKTLPIFNTFIKINNTDQEVDVLNWQAQQVQKLGGMMQVSIFTNIPITDVTDLALYKIAAQMRKVNSYYGVPVYLRFCPEMNGEWMTNFGLRPTAYKEKFIKLANYIHNVTNLTAMVWSPNIGGGTYGSPALASNFPAQGTEDFRLLDSNGNGRIENSDDSYTPYYPGDEYVDWVGLSVYNYARSPTGNQGSASPDRIITELNKFNFYSKFVKGKKPFMLSETGASTDMNLPAGPKRITAPHTPQEEIEVKRSWLTAVINGISALPEFKAAVWFEEKKPETVFGIELMRDFRITTTNDLSQTFVTSIGTSLRKNIFVQDTIKSNVYKCSGALNF